MRLTLSSEKKCNIDIASSYRYFGGSLELVSLDGWGELSQSPTNTVNNNLLSLRYRCLSTTTKTRERSTVKSFDFRK